MTWKYQINGFTVSSFYLSDGTTHELFEIVRRRGIFLAPVENRLYILDRDLCGATVPVPFLAARLPVP
jgi:hypothetical protein